MMIKISVRKVKNVIRLWEQDRPREEKLLLEELEKCTGWATEICSPYFKKSDFLNKLNVLVEEAEDTEYPYIFFDYNEYKLFREC